jgi:hypothetical protein
MRMHKKGKKKTRKEVDDEKRMDGFIRRGSFIFFHKGQVYTVQKLSEEQTSKDSLWSRQM